MALTPITEADLYAVLKPFRAEPADFAAGIQTRMKSAEAKQATSSPFEESPLLRVAAAFLPLPLLTGSKATLSAAKVAPLAGKYQLLGWVALPAISLFLLIGSTVLGARTIRKVQQDNALEDLELTEMAEAGTQWWRRHKWLAWLFCMPAFVLPLLGWTWLILLVILISMGVLLLMLKAMAKQGLGNRLFVGSSCVMGLGLLGQTLGFATVGQSDIFFVDQKLIVAILFLGAIVLQTLIINLGDQRTAMKGFRRVGLVFFATLVMGLVAWFAKPTFFPLTPAQIQQHVEAFEKAPYSSSSWRDWEMIATWSLESGLQPDFSKPRQLLAKEIAGEQNPFVLGSAFRAGLVEAEQIPQLNEFEEELSRLLKRRPTGRKPRSIQSINQKSWVVLAAAKQNLLTDEDHDYLEKRLLATWEELIERPSLEDALTVTQLLEVIDRPIDRERYRAQVHDWLRQFHSKQGGGFQIAGGFKLYPGDRVRTGNLRATWYGIELMKQFGIPDDFDMNWVRSFVKPMSMARFGDRRYLAAVIRNNVEHLSSIHQPTWREYVYYERSLVAAVLLVALCVYATMSSPAPVFLSGNNATT